jgi:tyrosine-specific transport protein
VVAPSGFVPSATALVGVWAYFLVESFVVVECLLTARSISKNKEEHPGIAAAAKSAFGTIGEAAVVVLLVLLIEATLVSQISRAGALFPSSYYRLGCSAVALSVAAIVFGGPRGSFVPTINSGLTVVFCVMAVVLFGAGAPAADWSRLTTTAANGGWSSLPRAIPTFLQLLVYGEILPTVCRLLQYQVGPIRLAIVLGSILPLGLEVGWAALGIGLIPTTTTVAVGDPVAALLAAGGPVQAPLLILAGTAILTTIIGSYLALQSTLEDLFPVRRRPSRRRRLVAATSIVAPALAIASISPDLFLRAIDFAGSYPVLLLWGVTPPTICLLQRRRRRRQGDVVVEQSSPPSSSLPLWWLWGLAILSSGLFAMSAMPDLEFMAGTLQSWLRRRCY